MTYPPGPEWRLPTDPGRLLIAGDTHADLDHWEYLIAMARQHQCGGIVQCGDFGYGMSDSWYVPDLDDLLDDAGLWTVWCDGNHEHHPRLRTRHPWRDTPTSSGVAPLTPTVFYAHRGARWTWNGWRWGALGGAYSIDRAQRRFGEGWFHEETVTLAEVARLIAPVPRIGHDTPGLDVLITHDCPYGVDLVGLPRLPALLERQVGPACEENRVRVLAAVVGTQPQLVFHGHYHLPNQDSVVYPTTDGIPRIGRVYGLSHNRDRENSFVVLEAPTAGDHPAHGVLLPGSEGQTDHPTRSDTTRKPGGSR